MSRLQQLQAEIADTDKPRPAIKIPRIDKPPKPERSAQATPNWQVRRAKYLRETGRTEPPAPEVKR